MRVVHDRLIDTNLALGGVGGDRNQPVARIAGSIREGRA